MTVIKANTVSSSSVLDLLDFCDAFNIPHNESPQFIREHLLDPAMRVDEQQVISLWHEIVAKAEIPHVGLLIGQQINPAAKGLLASWISQCETLGEAFKVFQQNIPLMSPSEQWHVKTIDGYLQLSLNFAANKGYPTAAIERSMSALMMWSNSLTGENLRPIKATFNFSKPGYFDQYQSIFGDNIQFNQADNNLIFKSDVLDLAIQSANPLLKTMIQLKAKEAFDELGKNISLSQQVTNILQNNIAKQNSSIEYVSDALSISRQTLYRKLKQEGTDFKSLLNEVRKTKAIELLQTEKSTMAHISLCLGFNETSSFYKAFQRWYGMTPSEYLTKINKQD